MVGPCKLIWDYGITGEKLGLWDYTLFEIGITKIMFEIGITGLRIIPNWDYGITCVLKLGLRDCTPFEIGMMGLQDSPYRALTVIIITRHIHTCCSVCETRQKSSLPKDRQLLRFTCPRKKYCLSALFQNAFHKIQWNRNIWLYLMISCPSK